MLPPLLPPNAAGVHTHRPTQIAYRPSFEPFTTTQYMTPEPESWRLEELERYQVDNLILDDIKIAESMYGTHASTAPADNGPGSDRHTRRPTSTFGSRSFFPASPMKVVRGACADPPQEWCFWYDRTVTSDEVDQRLAALINDMLYAFHHRIVDQATRQRYSVWELLESVRAVRDRLFTDTMGYRWEDERS